MNTSDVFYESSDVDPVGEFDKMDIPDTILRGIFSHGWEKPSPIQQKAIQPFISGRDMIAQAQSGTGKTGSFCIGSMARIDSTLKKPQVLMLSPVHDLAIQTYNIVKSLASFSDIQSTLLIGKGLGGIGLSSRYSDRKDIPEPDFNAHVIVGTPGRVLDCIRRRKLSNDNLKVFILDEADEILSKGFKEQIRNIFSTIPEEVQITLFSATMPPDILELSNSFMRNPTRILVNSEELTLEGIKQFYVYVDSEQQKIDVLEDIYETISVTQAILFVNSKPKAIQLKEILEKQNYTISVMHGGLNQYERNDVLNSFRSGHERILIATDILSRGIDIQQISLVINYDMPFRVEQYIHRIGRSGRYGRKGVGINLIVPNDVHALKRIEQFYATSIESLPQNYGSYL
jgi:translation initiation factor 4A